MEEARSEGSKEGTNPRGGEEKRRKIEEHSPKTEEHSPTRPTNHQLTHPLAHDWPTDSHTLTHSPTRPLTQSLTLPHSLTHSLTPPLTHLKPFREEALSPARRAATAARARLVPGAAAAAAHNEFYLRVRQVRELQVPITNTNIKRTHIHTQVETVLGLAGCTVLSAQAVRRPRFGQRMMDGLLLLMLLPTLLPLILPLILPALLTTGAVALLMLYCCY
jgi:hypothetical protein